MFFFMSEEQRGAECCSISFNLRDSPQQSCSASSHRVNSLSHHKNTPKTTAAAASAGVSSGEGVEGVGVEVGGG